MRFSCLCCYALLLTACASQEPLPPRGVIEFRLASFEAKEGWQNTQVNKRQESVYLSNIVSIHTQDIASVLSTFDPQGQPAVLFKMTAVGRRKFAQMTKGHIGQPVGLMLNGVLLTAAVVQDEIAGGHFMLTGLSSLQEASDIANRANGHSSKK